MIETCRCKDTSWNAKSSTEPERKARTARKKLRVLRLGHPPFSEMMEGASGRSGTATDLDGDTKIEAGGWGEVLFIRRFAFGPRNRPSLNYKGFPIRWFQALFSMWPPSVRVADGRAIW